MALYHRLIGKAAHLVWRMTKPRTIGVRAVVLDQDDRVALVRHTYTDQWYLPGGGVKKGESIEAALLRELKEELAIVGPRIERVLGVYHSRRQAKDEDEDHTEISAPDHLFQPPVRVRDRRDPARPGAPGAAGSPLRYAFSA